MSLQTDIEKALGGTPYSRCEVVSYGGGLECTVRVKWFDIGEDWDPAIARRIVGEYLAGKGFAAWMPCKTLWITRPDHCPFTTGRLGNES